MMEKRNKHFGPAHFKIDKCRKCDLFWLDYGELAKLQLIYEYSDQGMERMRMKERLANMTEQQKQELDERIASLPEWSIFSDTFASLFESIDGHDPFIDQTELFDE